MPSSSGADETLTSPTEQQANGQVEAGMDAKLMVATASGDVQQLKDLVKMQESQMMVVVMAKQAAPAEKHHQGNMDPHLLALASSGSCEKLQTLLNDEAGQSSGNGSTNGSMPTRRARSYYGDTEANESILAGKTAEGDTALHVVAACGQGDNFFTRSREAKHLVQQNNKQARPWRGANGAAAPSPPDQGAPGCQWQCEDTELCAGSGEGCQWQCEDTATRTQDLPVTGGLNNPRTGTGNKWWWRRWCWCWRLTRTERHALLTTYGYGDGNNFLKSARIIYGKAKHLLFVQNNKGDTPLHCAARAGKSNMVACLIDLAFAEGEDRIKELLRKENKHKETALHEAVRVGNNYIVNLLMEEDSDLASFPEDNNGTSPMYLAIMLRQYEIVKTLYNKSSDGKLSFSGPNGQNALHAAILRNRDLIIKLLEWIGTHHDRQNMDHITTQRGKNGSTPLHFAAAVLKPSSVCRQVLEANPDALYQPDHAGFFPIHVAASVGLFKNVDMFVTKCPGNASLRDAKGRTFLHVAVEKKALRVIRNTCRNLSLSWIMNMVDNDGNTALHLAVETGSLRMFCSLLENPQVNLNLPNKRGETPLDMAEYKIREFHYGRSSEALICRTLRIVGAAKGVCRWDQLLQDNETVRVKSCDEIKEMDVLKDSTGTLCIGSVLITTVTFGATFAVPGGYIADDHSNGGSPILARRYAFDAFIASNTLAFVFSAMATIGLMYSGSPLLYPRSRRMHLVIAVYLLSISITSLAAAFALGAYVVLAPVAHKTAVSTCVLASLVVLYRKMEFVGRRLHLLPPLCKRKGLIWAWGHLATVVMSNMLFEDWPLIFIFGWATYAKPAFIQK